MGGADCGRPKGALLCWHHPASLTNTARVPRSPQTRHCASSSHLRGSSCRLGRLLLSAPAGDLHAEGCVKATACTAPAILSMVLTRAWRESCGGASTNQRKAVRQTGIKQLRKSHCHPNATWPAPSAAATQILPARYARHTQLRPPIITTLASTPLVKDSRCCFIKLTSGRCANTKLTQEKTAWKKRSSQVYTCRRRGSGKKNRTKFDLTTQEAGRQAVAADGAMAAQLPQPTARLLLPRTVRRHISAIAGVLGAAEPVPVGHVEREVVLGVAVVVVVVADGVERAAGGRPRAQGH